MISFFKAPKPPAAEKRAGKEHMKKVKMCRCVICGSYPPNDAHHCFCDRYSGKRTSDWQVIPLCKTCHQDGPLAIHNDKKGWVKRNGPDWEFIPLVFDMLEGEANL